MKKTNAETEKQLVKFLNYISIAKVLKDDSENLLYRFTEIWSNLNGFENHGVTGELLFLKSLIAYRYAHIIMHKKNDIDSLRMASRLFEFSDSHLPCQSQFSQTKFFTKLYRISVLKRIYQTEGSIMEDSNYNINQIWNELVYIFSQYQRSMHTQDHFRNLNDLYFNMMELICYENGFDISKIEGMGVCNDIQMFTSSKNSYQLIYSKPDFPFTNIQYSRDTAINIARSFPDSFTFEASTTSACWINSKGNLDRDEIKANNKYIMIYLMFNPERLTRPVGDRFRQALRRFLESIRQDTGEEIEIQNNDDVLSFANNSSKLFVGVIEKTFLTQFSDRHHLVNYFNQ